ncbi:MAG: hypothetical protein Greene07144_1134 [Parcubacteria group bacterium Greene0714_4]|nr:MAG: hypothetical protein Greene07144_1134 [Parcubacteria group bacterium Greene0714_4]
MLCSPLISTARSLPRAHLSWQAALNAMLRYPSIFFQPAVLSIQSGRLFRRVSRLQTNHCRRVNLPPILSMTFHGLRRVISRRLPRLINLPLLRSHILMPISAALMRVRLRPTAGMDLRGCCSQELRLTPRRIQLR